MKTKFNEVWAVVFAQVLCASTLMCQSPLLSIQGSMATPASQSCGLRSLYEVARIQKPGDPKMRAILNVPVVSEAISLSELASLSKDYQLDLVPVERLSGQALPVPSVAHWGRDHYVAILGRQGGNYRVFDPALDSTLWLPRDKLNARISGQFLASAPTAASEEWRRLSQVDAEQIVGVDGIGGKTQCHGGDNSENRSKLICAFHNFCVFSFAG